MHLRLVLYTIVAVSLVAGLRNGLGLRPAMGWNSWYDLKCTTAMNETSIRATTDKIIELGLDKLGYEYVNLDDCWAHGRDSSGVVYPDPVRFPSGIKALADYVHSKGLKFGIYTCRGNYTCAKRPGSHGYEEIDAKTYASWGVDYIKSDSCFASQDHDTAFSEYAAMRDVIYSTKRPMYFSLCGWNSWYAPQGFSLGNSWRIGPDTTDWDAVLKNINANAGLSIYASPGGWNDPCLLIPGLVDSKAQARSQFSMWAIMASPLIISANIRDKAFAQFIDIYTNPEIIGIDQDVLGKQGRRIVGDDLSSTSPTNVWGRELSNGWAVAFINVGDTSAKITCDVNCLRQMKFSSLDTIKIRDAWQGKDMGTVQDMVITQTVAPGDTSVLRLFLQ